MFAYDYYHKIIEQLLESGYTFGKFESSGNENQTVYLRHDVDM